MIIVVLLVAFVCFILAAFGVAVGHVALLALGMAVLTAAFIIWHWPGRSAPP
jgi:hypothetical protein